MSDVAQVGRYTIISAGYKAADLAPEFLQLQMRAAEVAFASGNLRGLSDAVDLLRTYRPDGGAWPEWVQSGVAATLATRGVEASGRRGRHARASTQAMEDAVDFVRATLLDDQMRRHGLSKTAASTAVSEMLRGDAGGTPEVIRAAHTRFHARVVTDPQRYYPLLDRLVFLILSATRK